MSADNSPKISIAMPVYNGGHYFDLALQSALAQTYTNIEIVIVNDGSTDEGETRRIAQRHKADPRIRYFEQANGGAGAALNTALRNMTGEFFTWLSHDDIYLPEKTERQLAFHRRIGGRAAILFCDYHLIDTEGARFTEVKLPHQEYITTPMLPLLRGGVNGCTVFAPIDIMHEFYPFDASQRYTQDYDFWNRVLSKYEFIHQPETLIEYRVHPNQDTQANEGLVAIEGDRLWKKMVDDRSEIERVHLNGSGWRFFTSMADFLDNTSHKQAMAHARLRADRAVQSSLVSVVVPFFNEIQSTIEAIQSVLDQTYPHIEVIVVDDGSTQDCGEVKALVKSDRRIRFFQQKNAGPGSARNRGISESRGDYIAFLDADDRFAPDKVHQQVNAMHYEGAVISHTSYEVTFPERFRRKAIINSGAFMGQMYPAILSNCPIATPTVMIHKALIAQGFQFPTGSNEGEDVMAWIWAVQRHRLLGIQQPLSCVEWSSTSAALNIQRSLRGLKFLVSTLKTDPIHGRHKDHIGLLEGMISKHDNSWMRRGNEGPFDEDLITDVFGHDDEHTN